MFGKYVVLDLIKAKKSIDTQSFYARVDCSMFWLDLQGVFEGLDRVGCGGYADG